MERIELIKSGKDLIYLIYCAVEGKKADTSMLDMMDLEMVYKMAKKHSLVAMSFLPIENVAFDNRDKYEEVLSKWKESKEKAVRKEVFLEIEKKDIETFFDEKGIWYVLLKGSVLKYLYPKSWCREMADIDILFDINYRSHLREFMKARGYEIKSYKLHNHDVYMKAPVYNFEMHIALYNSATNTVWDKYYENVKDKLIKNPNKKYGYDFSIDDFYIYITTHSYKHFETGGNGIRTLLDIYIYLSKYEQEMNWDYISKEIEFLGISEYESRLRVLSKKIFCEEELSIEDEEILEYLISNSLYGYKDEILKKTIEKNLVKIQGNKGEHTVKTKIKYIMQRLFPDMKIYRKNHPFIYKTKIFIPFFYLYRIIIGLIKRGKYVFEELKTLRKM